jgi:hypothetical protein
MSRPTTEVRLRWEGGERFSGSAGAVDVVVDGSADDQLSPMQALALGLAGCMSIDVATILQKGRQPLTGMEVELLPMSTLVGSAHERVGNDVLEEPHGEEDDSRRRR